MSLQEFILKQLAVGVDGHSLKEYIISFLMKSNRFPRTDRQLIGNGCANKLKR